MAIYAAGCSSLSQLATHCQLPLFKIGCTIQRDLLIRQAEFRADRYGCATKSGSISEDSGWDDWEMRQRQATFPISDASPLRYTTRALMVRLPKTLSFKAFERQFQTHLTNISLFEWANSPIGCDHFAALRMDPSIAQRFTAYRFGSGTRHARAREIYICRPRDDFARIAAFVEHLIVQHVLSNCDSSVCAGQLAAHLTDSH